MINNAADQKYIQMTQTPVEKLILKLAVPSIISMLVTTVYNAADTFFIGQISTSASGAVGVCFSAMAIIQALGFFFGQGSGNSISRALGNQHAERAEQLASLGFFTALGCGTIFGVLGLIFLDPLVYFLGATETIYPHAVAYLRIILIGAPIMTASFVLNNLLRFQGNAYFGMIGLMLGGILNVILDPILIFAFGLETAGAALATVISQFVGLIVLLSLCNRYCTVKVHLRNYRFTARHWMDIIQGGLPSLLRQGIASIAAICLNLAAKPYGDAAISAMSIVSKITMFTNSAMLGFGQGFQPVCGFNYGAQLYDRVKKGFFFCVKVSFVVLTCLSIGEFFFADLLVGLFRKGDPEVIAIGGRALQYQCLSIPLFSLIVMSNMMLQTSGKMVSASITGIARQGILLIPILQILPQYIGLAGIQMAQPLADLATALLSVPFCISFLRDMERKMKQLQS